MKRKIEDLILSESKKLEKETGIKEFLDLKEEERTLVNDLKNYPHAFVIGCIMDRQYNATKAWSIPHKLSIILKSFDIHKLLNFSVDDYKKIFKKNKLHRLNEEMPKFLYLAIHRIKSNYNFDASKIWKGNQSSAEIILRFLEFEGIGIKIATMATNILFRHFKISMKDRSSIDISPDVHVLRVFIRCGLIEKQNKNNLKELTIYKARSLSPDYPGRLDYFCWKIGRTVCHKENPDCNNCILNALCPKIITNF